MSGMMEMQNTAPACEKAGAVCKGAAQAILLLPRIIATSPMTA